MAGLQLQQVLLSHSRPLLALLKHLAVLRNPASHTHLHSLPDLAAATPSAATQHSDLSQQHQQQHHHFASSSRSIPGEPTSLACQHVTPTTAENKGSRSNVMQQAYSSTAGQAALGPTGVGIQLRGFAASAAAVAAATLAGFCSNSGIIQMLHIAVCIVNCATADSQQHT
jgi:hypothetical protein